MVRIVEIKRNAVADLCARYHVRRLELFGSATKEGFDEASSDLDFIVEFEELAPQEHANAYFDLLEGLQQIFGRPIDLVERRAVRNPYFLRAVDQDRVEVYAAA